MANRKSFNTFLERDQYDWLGRQARLRGLQPSVYLRQLIDEKRAVCTQPQEEKFYGRDIESIRN